MLKDKSKMLALGAASLIIWILVGFRAFKMIKTDNTSFKEHNTKTLIAEIDLIIDTFNISGDITSPFAPIKNKSTAYTTPQRIERNNQTPLSLTTKPKQSISWPKISFHGLVEGDYFKGKTGLFSIDGNEFIVKEGEERYAVAILKVWHDSSSVKYKGEKKTIIR